MRKAIIYLIVFLTLLVSPVAIRYLQYYRPLTAMRAAPPTYSAAGIADVPTPEANGFPDNPAFNLDYQVNVAHVAVLDMAHNNQVSLEELSYLDGLLAGRSFQLRPHTEGDLDAALRSAGALVVIAPVTGYSEKDVLAVRDFVGRGGRVLLVGDPTRYRIEFDEADIFAPPVVHTSQVPLNDLANIFDITFRGDYLYNTTENEGNFRNILLDNDAFSGDELTDGLQRLAFYSSHSLQLGPTAAPVLLADSNTWSSATDRPGGLILAALSPAESATGQVLALGDLHFLTEPYNTVYDNGEFAGRVADFLASGVDTNATLASFPYFLRSPVDLVYSENPNLGPDAFDDVIALQSALRQVGLSLALVDEPDPQRDTIYAGLYNQAGDVSDLLEGAGIELTIRPAIQPPVDDGEEEPDETRDRPAATRVIESSLGRIEMSGSALILLDTTGERRQVVVLAASNDGLENAIARLRAATPLDGMELTDCLLQADLAICPTHIANEPVEYELVTSGPGDLETSPADETENRPDDSGQPSELDATKQGVIGLGESKGGELAAEEAHTWTFNDGPAVVDIIVDPADDMDAIVELYGPDNVLLANVDSAFAGGREEIRGFEIPDEGEYTILIRDFFNDGGSYELRVDRGEESSTLERIFIFADDDGEPVGNGLTSAPVLADLLSDTFEVTVWTASLDGPLPDDTLQDFDLLIWESGTYRDEDGLLGEDTATIIDYLDSGGDILITGSSPTVLGPVELAPLQRMAIVTDDPILSAGFEAGQEITLDRIYNSALAEITDPGVGELVFLERAEGEEGEGAFVGVAAIENNALDQKTVFLLAPFAGLSADVRATLLTNIVTWFGS